jgi:hypothetical protein
MRLLKKNLTWPRAFGRYDITGNLLIGQINFGMIWSILSGLSMGSALGRQVFQERFGQHDEGSVRQKNSLTFRC